VPAYGAFASKVNRIRLINYVSLFFISNLLIFYVLSNTAVSPKVMGIAFFLWVGIFNVMVIAQFWSFANDIYTPEQGKRLFAIVGFGSTVGAVAGSKAAGMLVKPIGVYQMMLVSAGLLLIVLVITNLINKREESRMADPERRKEVEMPLGKEGGFKLVISTTYLLLIGLLILIINWVNTNGEYILGKTVAGMAKAQVESGQAAAGTEKEIIGGFYADFQFWQNLLGALFQLFLVSRVIKYIGIQWSLFIMPVISLSGYSLLALAPILSYIRTIKILENSTDYSLQNTVRHALFLPTSREAKYKAKQAIDTFFWRAGDMLSGISVALMAGILAMGVRNFAAINIILVVAWILIASGIGREYRKLSEKQQPEPVKVG
jgi:ATP:ADP antiporter, AAA family